LAVSISVPGWASARPRASAQQNATTQVFMI
jgi:hypothetical protein